MNKSYTSSDVYGRRNSRQADQDSASLSQHLYLLDSSHCFQSVNNPGSDAWQSLQHPKCGHYKRNYVEEVLCSTWLSVRHLRCGCESLLRHIHIQVHGSHWDCCTSKDHVGAGSGIRSGSSVV
jgi:hypothetical protein